MSAESTYSCSKCGYEWDTDDYAGCPKCKRHTNKMNKIAEQVTDAYIRLYDNRANRDVLVSMFDTAITEATTPLHAEITTLKNALNNVFDAEEKHAERAIEPPNGKS